MTEFLLAHILSQIDDLTDRELVTLKEQIVVLQVKREDARITEELERTGKI